MKINDPETRARFAAMERESAIRLIADCLFQGLDNVFNNIRRHYNLKAPTMHGLAEKVYEKLMKPDSGKEPHDSAG